MVHWWGWLALLGLERLDGDVLDPQRNAVPILPLATNCRDAKLFPDAVALFNHHDLFHDRNHQDIALVAGLGEGGDDLVDSDTLQVDLVMP